MASMTSNPGKIPPLYFTIVTSLLIYFIFYDDLLINIAHSITFALLRVIHPSDYWKVYRFSLLSNTCVESSNAPRHHFFQLIDFIVATSPLLIFSILQYAVVFSDSFVSYGRWFRTVGRGAGFFCFRLTIVYFPLTDFALTGAWITEFDLFDCTMCHFVHITHRPQIRLRSDCEVLMILHGIVLNFVVPFTSPFFCISHQIKFLLGFSHYSPRWVLKGIKLSTCKL